MMEISQHSVSDAICVKEEYDASRRVLIKEEAELDCLKEAGDSYIPERCKDTYPQPAHIKVKDEEEMIQVPGYSRTQQGESSQQGHPWKAPSASTSEEKQFPCIECGRVFSYPSDLKRHARIHMEDKPFHCLECGKGFRFSCDVKKHMRIHTSDKPFCCVQCGKSFSQSDYLKVHMKIHTGEKPFRCLECGKKFSTSMARKAHSMIHSGDKPYHCLECGKSFRQLSTLNVHKRIHTGEKPFKCSECGKNFSRSWSLKDHTMRNHSFQCSDCGKSFNSHDHLIRHRQIHTGKRLLQCYYCGDAFSSRSWLKEHITRNCRLTHCPQTSETVKQQNCLSGHTRALPLTTDEWRKFSPEENL